MSIEGQGHFLTLFFPGFVYFLLIRSGNTPCSAWFKIEKNKTIFFKDVFFLKKNIDFVIWHFSVCVCVWGGGGGVEGEASLK